MFGARARARSTDTVPPWSAAPAFGLSLAYPVGAMAILVYGSLLPFSFNLRALDLSNPIGAMTLASASLEDVWVNLLLYGPLGLLVSLCARRWFRSWVLRIGSAIGVAFSLSLAIEVLQTGVAERVPSWLDLLLNTTGAACGALLGTWIESRQNDAALLERAGRWARDVRCWALTLFAGLLIYGLAPFDFVMRSDALHDSFRRARWDLTQPRAIGLTEAPMAALGHELTGASWFALLGALLALAALGRRRPAAAIASSIKQGVLLAATIEMLQLFTQSHCCDVGSIVLRSLATAGGAWFAVHMFEPARTRFRNQNLGYGLANMALVGLLALQSVLLFMSARGIGSGTFDRLFECRWGVLPFERLWRTSAPNAVTALLSMVIVAGSLSLVLSLLARRSATGIARSISVVGTVAVVLAFEPLRAASRDGLIDLTASIVAAAVAYAVTDGVRWIMSRPLTRSRRNGMDPMLDSVREAHGQPGAAGTLRA